MLTCFIEWCRWFYVVILIIKKKIIKTVPIWVYLSWTASCPVPTCFTVFLINVLYIGGTWHFFMPISHSSDDPLILDTLKTDNLILRHAVFLLPKPSHLVCWLQPSQATTKKCTKFNLEKTHLKIQCLQEKKKKWLCAHLQSMDRGPSNDQSKTTHPTQLTIARSDILKGF